jgi:carboxyl-terminal processing protease
MPAVLPTLRSWGSFVVCAASLLAQKTDYAGDVAFAIERLGSECKVLLTSKKIDWKKVTAPLLAEAKKVKTDADHCRLLWRLVARLQDGHAEVRPLGRAKDVKVDWPDRSGGPGLFLCRAQQKLWVKNSWGPAAEVGIAPGQEVVAVDGMPAAKWLAAQQQAHADLVSFSTSQQAFFFATHQGLGGAPGTRLVLETNGEGGKKKRTVTYGKVNQTPPGPAFPPPVLGHSADLQWGRTAAGNGWIHVRRCKETVVSQLDEALAALGELPGLVLDFRGNSGGGFDHEALFGRFLPAGVEWRVGSGYRSAGAHPFGGPMVVVVDANVRSAGETGAGQFLEDGRAYGIGETPTAGMSSQKTTVELPSGLFALYVSTGSNKARFQGGKGIEGVGVIPHEIVEFAPADLVQQKDTLLVRADALLADFPQGKVRYVPAEHGWKAPAK